MNVATPSSKVGIRELKNGLSGYIDRVRNGEEVIVTDRGRPVARLSALDAAHDHLAELIATGIVQAPTSSKRRHVPKHRIKSKGTVSDLVAEQRR
jgi:prevent-host-death family protein